LRNTFSRVFQRGNTVLRLRESISSAGNYRFLVGLEESIGLVFGQDTTVAYQTNL
jgi:hypothetical protein